MAQVGTRKDKTGRNKIGCKYYALVHRREKNKIVKLKKHLVKFEGDKVALQALKCCQVLF